MNNTVWLQAGGSALQMGWNNTENVDGAHADGLDIIGDDPRRTIPKQNIFYCAIVALRDIHNHAVYKNIIVENVRHEGTPGQLFRIGTMIEEEDPHKNMREGRGSVDGILFKNITTAQKPLHISVFNGNGREPGTIQNVTFENLQIAKQLVTDKNASSYILQKGKTSGFRYVSPTSQPPGRRN